MSNTVSVFTLLLLLCRLWKIPEESHLVFRSPSMAQYAVSYVTGNEWVSGGADGSLQVCIFGDITVFIGFQCCLHRWLSALLILAAF
jgi:hypothetical protein